MWRSPPPIILNRQLWERSGHWDHYKQNMYTTVIDGEDYAIKPMNCPGGMLVYASEPHSYRDLPLRVGEIGLVHRHELSGALHGLFRVRCFSQDDAHIFMTQDQLKDVIQETVRLFDEVYSTFGLSYTIELSTMPEDHIGTVEQWEHNQDVLKDAITDMGKDFFFVINEGDGAFYGPKLDFHLADSLGRTWQCGTIQLDSQLPERFELEYTGEDGQKHRPVMIHRVVLGSIERFIGVITEHFAGAFPAWLAPVQVKILPVTDRARPVRRPDRPRSWTATATGWRWTTAARRSARRSGGPAGEGPLYAGGGRPGYGESDCLPAPALRRGPGRHVPGRLRGHHRRGRAHQGDPVIKPKSKFLSRQAPWLCRGPVLRLFGWFRLVARQNRQVHVVQKGIDLLRLQLRAGHAEIGIAVTVPGGKLALAAFGCDPLNGDGAAVPGGVLLHLIAVIQHSIRVVHPVFPIKGPIQGQRRALRAVIPSPEIEAGGNGHKITPPVQKALAAGQWSIDLVQPLQVRHLHRPEC